MVHYSSDHVFDGAKSAPYVEDDEAAPLNMYGRSKLAGERAVQAANPAHLIFRASWVYGVFGHSFLKSMLMALRQPEALRVVGDQRGAPTDAAYIADVTALAVARYLHGQGDYPFGLYHLSASGDASWHEYACHRAPGPPRRPGPDADAGRHPRRAGQRVSGTPRSVRPMPRWTAAGWPGPSRAPHWHDGVTHALAAIAGTRNLI